MAMQVATAKKHYAIKDMPRGTQGAIVQPAVVHAGPSGGPRAWPPSRTASGAGPPGCQAAAAEVQNLSAGSATFAYGSNLSYCVSLARVEDLPPLLYQCDRPPTTAMGVGGQHSPRPPRRAMCLYLRPVPGHREPRWSPRAAPTGSVRSPWTTTSGQLTGGHATMTRFRELPNAARPHHHMRHCATARQDPPVDTGSVPASVPHTLPQPQGPPRSLRPLGAVSGTADEAVLRLGYLAMDTRMCV